MSDSRFRLNGKNLFLTYPRCDVSHRSALEQLYSRLPRLQWGVICTERHADGTPHLHSLLVLESRCDLHSASCLDLDVGRNAVSALGFNVSGPHGQVRQHGNYAVARSVERSFRYCLKEGLVSFFRVDPDADSSAEAVAGVSGVGVEAVVPGPGVSGSDVHGGVVGIGPGERCGPFLGITEEEARGLIGGSDGKRKRPSVWSVIDGLVREGKSVKDIILATPGSCQHIQRVEVAVSRFLSWNLPVLPGIAECVAESLEHSNMVIAGWVMQNLRGQVRPFKAKQLYVSGNAGVGKTSFVSILSKCVNVYVAPNDGAWWDTYDDAVDLVVFDEFKGNYSIQFLNGFLEGAAHGFPLPRRGTAPLTKRKNVACLFLGNYRLEEAYHTLCKDEAGLARLETLRGRLLELDLGAVPLRVKVVAKEVIAPSVNVVGNPPVMGPSVSDPEGSKESDLLLETSEVLESEPSGETL
jgi:hypothetical protein